MADANCNNRLHTKFFGSPMTTLHEDVTNFYPLVVIMKALCRKLAVFVELMEASL